MAGDPSTRVGSLEQPGLVRARPGWGLARRDDPSDIYNRNRSPALEEEPSPVGTQGCAHMAAFESLQDRRLRVCTACCCHVRLGTPEQPGSGRPLPSHGLKDAGRWLIFPPPPALEGSISRHLPTSPILPLHSVQPKEKKACFSGASKAQNRAPQAPTGTLLNQLPWSDRIQMC